MDLHVRLAGSPHNPPLLLLHGFLGDARDWAALIPYFSTRYYCLVPDLPGHGQTQVLDTQFSMPACAQLLIEWLDTHQINCCDLLGYSMGGRLALYLALHFPTRFRRVILESASPGLATAAEREARRRHDEKLARQLETEPLADFLRKWYQLPLFSGMKQNSPEFKAMWGRRLENNPRLLAHSLRMMGTGSQPSLWPKLSQANTPILLLVGENDPKFVKIARQIEKKCGRCLLKSIAKAGHVVHFEKPADFAASVLEFLTMVITD